MNWKSTRYISDISLNYFHFYKYYWHNFQRIFREFQNTFYSQYIFFRIGHILCRNCLLQRVIEGKIKGGGIEVTGRRGRRRRKLLDDLRERRGYSQLKEEALDRTMWRARFGRGFGPAVRQTTKWMNEYLARIKVTSLWSTVGLSAVFITFVNNIIYVTQCGICAVD